MGIGGCGGAGEMVTVYCMLPSPKNDFWGRVDGCMGLVIPQKLVFFPSLRRPGFSAACPRKFASARVKVLRLFTGCGSLGKRALAGDFDVPSTIQLGQPFLRAPISYD